jgi:hypothetical protein
MTKSYRVACSREIPGVVRQIMWDGIDCHRARMLDWIAESRFRAPHHVIMCSAPRPPRHDDSAFRRFLPSGTYASAQKSGSSQRE